MELVHGSYSDGAAFVSLFLDSLACHPFPESPNELRIPKNALESTSIQLQCLRMLKECVSNPYNFLNWGIHGHNFEQFRLTQEMQVMTIEYTIQLRTSGTDYISALNPKICQFVAIHGIRGCSGIPLIRL